MILRQKHQLSYIYYPVCHISVKSEIHWEIFYARKILINILRCIFLLVCQCAYIKEFVLHSVDRG